MSAPTMTPAQRREYASLRMTTAAWAERIARLVDQAPEATAATRDRVSAVVRAGGERRG